MTASPLSMRELHNLSESDILSHSGAVISISRGYVAERGGSGKLKSKVKSAKIKVAVTMRIVYDKSVDILTSCLRECDYAESDKVSASVIVVFDKEGKPMTIEILDAV